MASGAGHAAIEATPRQPDSDGQLRPEQVEQPGRRHLAAALALDPDGPASSHRLLRDGAVVTALGQRGRIEGALAVGHRGGGRTGRRRAPYSTRAPGTQNSARLPRGSGGPSRREGTQASCMASYKELDKAR